MSAARNTKNVYGGGDGSSIEDAIIINSSGVNLTPLKSYTPEMNYITALCKSQKKKFIVKDRITMQRGRKIYEKLFVEFSDGEKKAFIFDVTAFYGNY